MDKDRLFDKINILDLKKPISFSENDNLNIFRLKMIRLIRYGATIFDQIRLDYV